MNLIFSGVEQLITIRKVYKYDRPDYPYGRAPWALVIGAEPLVDYDSDPILVGTRR